MTRPTEKLPLSAGLIHGEQTTFLSPLASRLTAVTHDRELRQQARNDVQPVHEESGCLVADGHPAHEVLPVLQQSVSRRMRPLSVDENPPARERGRDAEMQARRAKPRTWHESSSCRPLPACFDIHCAAVIKPRFLLAGSVSMG